MSEVRLIERSHSEQQTAQTYMLALGRASRCASLGKLQALRTSKIWLRLAQRCLRRPNISLQCIYQLTTNDKQIGLPAAGRS